MIDAFVILASIITSSYSTPSLAAITFGVLTVGFHTPLARAFFFPPLQPAFVDVSSPRPFFVWLLSPSQPVVFVTLPIQLDVVQPPLLHCFALHPIILLIVTGHPLRQVLLP